MTKYFADISSFQRDDLAFFQGLVNAGVEGIMIKTTQGSQDGDNYTNPKALLQTRNALKAGMNVGFYHYFKASSLTDTLDEARFFEQSVVNLGFDKDTPVCVDVEDRTLSTSLVARHVDTFISYLENKGYTNVIQYSISSWFNNNILDAYKHKTWVAYPDATNVGVYGNIVGWQYTWKWGGTDQDMSVDYGLFDNKKAASNEEVVIPIPPKPKVEDIIKLTEETHPVDRLGIERPETYAAGSTWKSSDIVMINNEPHYKIATDIFVPILKTTFKDIIIVKYLDDSLAPVFDSKGNRVQNASVSIGKSFKTAGIKVIDDIPMVKIATDEYLPLEYTSGSGFKS